MSYKIDEFVNREDMLGSLKRIQYSLNRRFEKDADLFISNQQSQEIKNMMCDNNWQGIHGIYITKAVSVEILTIEIIKNSWIISKIPNSDKKYLEEIFESCNKKVFLESAKKIIDHRINSPHCLKEIIIPIYYENISIKLCEKILDTNKDNLLYSEDIRFICVKRVLDRCKSPRELYNKMNNYLKLNQIYKESGVFRSYIKNIDDEKFTYKLAQDIFEFEIKDRDNYKEGNWFRIFRSFGKITFDICVKYLEEEDYENDFSKSITRYLMAPQLKESKTENVEYYEDEWVKLFDNISEEKRTAVLLGLQNIFNKNSREKIVNRIMKTYILKKEHKNILQKILSHEEIDEPINSYIVDILINHKLNKVNRQAHLNFLASEFLKRYKAIKELNLILEHINDTYFDELIMSLINQSRKVDKKVLKYLLNYILVDNGKKVKPNLINKIEKSIEANTKDFIIVKDIIEKYDFVFFKRVFANV